MKKVAIFASGSGTNAQNIAEYFRYHPSVRISLILSNKTDAYVLERASKLNIPSFVFSGKEFRETTRVLDILKEYEIDFLVLAGFMLLVPAYLIQAYPGKIVNIHPALLPKHGGKGMYGHFVHEAVINAGETESGISIHFVNERYDEGDVIFQSSCPVLADDTPDSLANRIHELEYSHYPRVIEEIVAKSP